MSAIASALVRADEMGGGELCFVPHEGCPTLVASIRELPEALLAYATYEVTSEATRYSNATFWADRLDARNSAARRACAWRSRENRKAKQLELPR